MAEFKNPNQQGAQGSNNNLLVMMLVMVVVFTVLQYFRAKHNPQTASPNQAPSASQIAAKSPSAAGIPQPSAELLRNAGVTPPPSGSGGAPTIQAPAETTTTI